MEYYPSGEVVMCEEKEIIGLVVVKTKAESGCNTSLR